MGKMEEQLISGCEEPAEDWIPIYKAPRDSKARDLIAAEIVPGISVTIDPDKIENAREILARMKTILRKVFGEIE